MLLTVLLTLLLTLALGLALAKERWGIEPARFMNVLAQRVDSPAPADDRVTNVGKQWLALLDTLPALPERQQLQQVNRFIHRHIRYREDSALYGQSDYWASITETFAHGLGDCEDYAIAQYASLRLAGIADSKLRLVYVRARIGGPQSGVSQAHMVLGYYPSANAEPLILDSLISYILPASQRPDLTPVFSFNAAGLWVGAGGQQARTSPLERLSRWQSVLNRLSDEGIRWQQPAPQQGETP